MLDQVESREAFHILALGFLADRLGAGSPLALRLKGGVNLRLFFGSERYSEDMDLDVDVRLASAMPGHLLAMLKDPGFLRAMRAHGLRLATVPTSCAKATDTVTRLKVVLRVGALEAPTKIEVSYRGDTPYDWSRVGTTRARQWDQYLGPAAAMPAFGQYDRTAAAWQKITALSGRPAIQVRDLFDLGLLLSSTLDPTHGGMDFGRLRASLPDETLDQAIARAVTLSDEMFSSQVGEYLPAEIAAAHAGQWEIRRDIVVAEIQRLKLVPHSGHDAPALPAPTPAGSSAQDAVRARRRRS